MKKVKICGLFRAEDIMAVNEAKPDYCGFILNFPKSHRNITKEKLRELVKELDPNIRRVGVFVDQPREFVADLKNEALIDIVQLHGSEDNDYIDALRRLIPRGSEIWQAIQIKSERDIIRANESSADFLILDAGQGTGRTFNWELLKEIRRPFGLAGGISLDNISEAMKTKAELLDISGGAETDKVKDPEKINRLIELVRSEVKND